MMHKVGKNQSGVIAIFLATILAILLLTTTTFAARVSVSELDQSSQIDRSEQAYYAAEAGVEDAIRRIDQAPQGTTVANIFPQQFGCSSAPCAGTSQPGDTFSLTGDGAGTGILTDSVSTNGSVSWRHRRVYEQSSSSFGTLVKDQTQQFDLTELCRRLNNSVYGTSACNPSAGNPAGYDPIPASHNIYQDLTGLQFCWNTTTPGAVLEITDVSYPAGNPGASSTAKYLTSSPGGPLTVTGGSFSNPSEPAYGTCAVFAVSSGTRHILRFKTVVGGVGPSGAGNGDQYSVTFREQLVESPQQPVANRLYLPNQSYLIDVVGESGDIHRRVVARKLTNGQILGVFDYVLYSGDPLKDLCKIGVNQSDSTQGDISYDPFNCGTVTSTNNDTVGAPSQRLEGETFAPQTWDRVVINDGAASKGQAMGLFTTSGVCKTANTTDFSSLTVRAYEWQYQGVDANMSLTVDGNSVYNGPVSYTNWGNIDVPTTGAAGSHTFCFSMTNDGYQNPGGPGNDRNLFVDYIDVNPGPGPTRIEGETMQPQNGCDGAYSDGRPDTSGGQVYAFWCSYTASFQHQGPFSQLGVRSYERQSQGDAQMIVQLDGSTVWSGTVSWQTGQVTLIPVTASPGNHNISITYPNDGGVNGYRDLYVDYIDIYP